MPEPTKSYGVARNLALDLSHAIEAALIRWAELHAFAQTNFEGDYEEDKFHCNCDGNGFRDLAGGKG
jgi:hypothetical protein